jgi:glycosyltransferase involved in cell wall biosynthesis
MRRHFEHLAPSEVAHEDDAAIEAPGRRRRTRGPHRVCVVGGIGLHKGYAVLLSCARDAARRGLDLEFRLVGHSIDDARLLATGRVFITGRFKPMEAVALISAQEADLGFVPSIWPETWCLSLGDIWRAGLPAAAFDLGAPAERIRRTGRGFLLPLGLGASAINNALLAAARADH